MTWNWYCWLGGLFVGWRDQIHIVINKKGDCKINGQKQIHFDIWQAVPNEATGLLYWLIIFVTVLGRSSRWSTCPYINKNLQTVIQPVSGRFIISSFIKSLTTNSSDSPKQWLWLVLPFACMNHVFDTRIPRVQSEKLWKTFFSVSIYFWRPDFCPITPSEQSSRVSVMPNLIHKHTSSPLFQHFEFWSEEAWQYCFWNLLDRRVGTTAYLRLTQILCECISFFPAHAPALLKPL